MQFQNIHTGEDGIATYEIGSRSRVKQGIGLVATKYVVATPWWYDGPGGRRYSLNTVLPVSGELVNDTLSRMARACHTGYRVAPDGTLQEILQPKVGNIVVGGEYKRKIAAGTDEQRAVLKQSILQRRGPAARGLLSLRDDGVIEESVALEIIDKAVEGSHSVYEADGKIWGAVQEKLGPQEQTLFFEATK